MKKTPILAIKLFVIAAVSALVLGLTNQATKPVIEARQKEEFIKAYSEAYPDGKEFNTVEEDVNEFIEEVIEVTDGSNQIGYVFKGIAKGGFGGDISYIMGVDNAGVVQGFKALTHSETKSYGSRIEDAEFVDGVTGADISKGVSSGQGNKDAGEIHALSGATVTTKAMTGGFQEVALKMSELSDEIGPMEAPKPKTYAKYYADLFPEANKFMDLEDEEGKILKDGVVKIVDVYKGEDHLGKIVQVVGQGFGGDINILLGVDNDKKIVSFAIPSHGETPDFGAAIETETYQNNIVGKSLAKPVKIKATPKKDSHILLISGATVTSNGMKEALNAAVESLKLAKEEGSQELDINALIEEEAKDANGPAVNYAEIFDKIDGSEAIEGAETNDKVTNIERAKKDDQEIGYILDVSAPGFAGKINFVLLVNNDGVIEDFAIAKHSETPDFGAAIEEEAYKNSIVGKDLSKLDEIKSKDKPAEDNEIQAISGATHTTDGMTEGLNAALEAFKTLVK